MKRRKDTQVGRKNAVEEDVPETQKEIASAKVLTITVSRIIEIRGTEDRIGSQGRRRQMPGPSSQTESLNYPSRLPDNKRTWSSGYDSRFPTC